jgi:hypothetical protein
MLSRNIFWHLTVLKRRLLVWLPVLVAAAASVAEVNGQSFVQQMRKEVREEKPPPPTDDPPPKQRRDDEDDEDDEGWELDWGLTKLIGLGVSSPVWAPMAVAADDYSQPLYFPCHPYAEDRLGYLTSDVPVLHATGPYSLRLRGDYGYNLDDTSLFGGQLLMETIHRWGVDAEARYWREQAGLGQHEQLWTGDTNLVFRFAQSPWLQMRLGAGMNWMSDHLGSDFGVNFTYGGDWFPGDPWVVSGEVDLGRLGESSLVHLRSTLGLQISSVECFSGYDYFAVGGARNHGLVTGIRLWY